MRARPSHDDITRELKSDDGLSLRDRVLFHYFNPCGLVAEKRATDDAIDAAVKAGKCKSGAILAYGGLADFGVENLRKLIFLKRPRRIPVRVALDTLRRDIDTARAFLARVEKESSNA